jgi:polysaccharide biosynthesis protein PslH
MKILVIGNRIPWPLHDGGAVATYTLLKELSQWGHQVVYFSYNTQKHHVSADQINEHFAFCEVITEPLNASIRPLNALKNLFSNRSYFLERYDQESSAAQVSQLLREHSFDLVQIEGLYSYPLVDKRVFFFGEPLLTSIEDLKEMGIPVVYRAHNVEHEIWQRLAKNEPRFWKRWYLNLQSKRLKKEEIQCIKRVSAVVGISCQDIQYFKSLQPNVHLYLPSVKTPINLDIEIQPDAIFHLGSMEWDANVQSLQWFLSKVWPRVKAAHPELKFHVAGKGIQHHQQMFYQTDVVNHGEVQDAQVFMKNHGISIVPLLAGSGIRMKIIEALSLGIPCVATEIAVQGLPLKKQDGIVAMAQDAQDFADQLIQLLSNRKKAISMAKLGHAYALQHHSPVKNLEELQAFYEQILNAKHIPS